MAEHVVVGGGLTGCLVAVRLARAGHRVSLVESSDSVLSAFRDVEIDGCQLNPGFYAIELPRAAPLGDLLQKDVGLSMERRMQHRFLLLAGHMVDSMAPLAAWPALVRDSVQHETVHYSSMDDCESAIDSNLLRVLKESSWRYSPWERSRGAALPWFLPRNLTVESSDEGDAFRTRVRRGELAEHVLVPEGGLFSDIAPRMVQFLASLGVGVHTGVSLRFDSRRGHIESLDQIGPIGRDAGIIFCAPAQSLLAGIDPEKLKELAPTVATRVLALVDLEECRIPREVTQILVLDRRAPDLARISGVPREADAAAGDPRALVLEFAVQGQWNGDDTELRSQVQKALSALGAKLNWRGSTEIGKAYGPTASWLNEASDIVEQWRQHNFSELRLKTHFGPINMAKAWSSAEELSANLE